MNTLEIRQPHMKENTEDARLGRIKFLNQLEKNITHTADGSFSANSVKSNIESYVGTCKIPTGLVGPIHYEKAPGEIEPVLTFAATTEGALIASMNRGASVINACGGFRAFVQDKLMLRAPLFCFESLYEAKSFVLWIKQQHKVLAEYVKQYSQRAELVEIQTNVYGRNVDTKFYYRTADAAGQNVTTICTWHACLWIEKTFNEQHPFKIKNFVLEGNGGSDKKFTYSAMIKGRGVNVVAECVIDRDILMKRLKVTPEEVLHFFNISHQVTTGDGMVGNNINVANAIAAIFAATGQDLACVHESAVGMLQIEPHPRGLYFSLKLPKLVVGTVGGGTGLPTQKEALELMGCYGTGKVERFAELIAGFSLGLEISTITAMISGQFALAHERLGRNKPIDFIKLPELKENYLQKNSPQFAVTFIDQFDEKNGIMTQITSRQSSKYLGLSLWQVDEGDKRHLALLKSKPTHAETLNCMYILTGLIDPKLAKSFCLYQDKSEFVNNHLREIEIADFLQKNDFAHMPKVYSTISDKEREGHMLLMEYMDESQYRLMNSENTPELWSTEDFNKVMHKGILASELLKKLDSKNLMHFKYSEYGAFFEHAIQILKGEYGASFKMVIGGMEAALHYLKNNEERILSQINVGVVHNDFNPRNVAVTKAGSVKIYDWELATLDVPHRDFIELYCFTKNKNMDAGSIKSEFEKHFQISNPEAWKEAYKFAFAKFLVTRVGLYLLGNKINNYSFMKSLLNNMMTINAEEKYFV